VANEGNGTSGRDPVEVTLRVDDPENVRYPLRKDDHAFNLSQTLQAAVDKAIDDVNWGPGPHEATVRFGVEFTKRNPGDIGAYKVALS
jgi:hypothetical protein